MSSWKLVEAVVEHNEAAITSNPTAAPTEAIQSEQDSINSTSNYSNSRYNNSGRGSYSGRRSNGRGEGGRGRSGRGRGRGRYPGPYRSKADRSYFSYLAVQQIDLIFNQDSLCMDTFIRMYMDEAGYVPISLVCTYQNVAQFQCSYHDILNKLKETVDKCKNIELDAVNELVRLKAGWEKFLMPNPFGGRGLPRYIKQNNAQYWPQAGEEGEGAEGEYAYEGAEGEQTAEQQS